MSEILYIILMYFFREKVRYLHKFIKKDLQKKMVFVSGPRQVGKTTLGLSFLKPAPAKHQAYFNWDIIAHQKIILRNELPLQHKLLVLDEIHKYYKWRAFLKGLYDEHHEDHSFLVTGSGRLDYFSKGGDSLMGRYFHYRLHPFSLVEISKNPNQQDLQALLRFGGFPEPLLTQSETHHRRWQNHRSHQIINEDLRDLSKVQEVSLVHLLVEALPYRVGSPLSIQSLREELQVSHSSVARWLELLESVYVVFRISPFVSAKIRAVKKEQKLYFWDWSRLDKKGLCFENLVASHLLKYCHYHQDVNGDSMELKYLRDTDKREVDFIIVKNKKPLFAVECKTKASSLSPYLNYFQERLKIPKCFQVHLEEKDFGSEKKKGRSMPFIRFCKEFLKI